MSSQSHALLVTEGTGVVARTTATQIPVRAALTASHVHQAAQEAHRLPESLTDLSRHLHLL